MGPNVMQKEELLKFLKGINSQLVKLGNSLETNQVRKIKEHEERIEECEKRLDKLEMKISAVEELENENKSKPLQLTLSFMQ